MLRRQQTTPARADIDSGIGNDQPRPSCSHDTLLEVSFVPVTKTTAIVTHDSEIVLIDEDGQCTVAAVDTQPLEVAYIYKGNHLHHHYLLAYVLADDQFV